MTRRLWAISPQPTHRSIPVVPWYKQRSSFWPRLRPLMRPSIPERQFRPRRNQGCFSSEQLQALAKAGSGDVLAGAILAMLAQGLEPFRAAVVGAFVHGLGGMIAGAVEGAAAVTARELLAYLPKALIQLGAKKR